MKGYKGFNKDLACTPGNNKQQYVVGQIYEMDGESKLCSKGFHFCEYPLDVFGYYPPAYSRYCEIEAEPNEQKDSDSKRVTKKSKSRRRSE